MRKLLFLAICAILFYVSYAVYSLNDLISGVTTGNAQQISDHVDFPSIRESIKEQLRSQLMDQALTGARNNSDPGSRIEAGLTAAFGPAVINNIVDGLLTPSGIARLLSKNKGGQVKNKPDYAKIFRNIDILGPTRYRLVSFGDKTDMTVAFKDLAWKVIDIQVPNDIFQKGHEKAENLLPPVVSEGTSMARIEFRDGKYISHIKILATDLEKMFSASMDERLEVDLSPPGVLEREIGAFVQRRITVRDGRGRPCNSTVESSGEDPDSNTNALVILRFDCKAVSQPLYYDASKLLSIHGASSRHGVEIIIDGTTSKEAVLTDSKPAIIL